MTATIYNGRGAPDAARTVSFALPAGDYSGLALTLDFLCNRIPAEIDGDGCCFATIPEEALRVIPCGTHRAALLLRGANGQEAIFASVPIRVSDIPGEASAYADVTATTPSFAPANAVTADALAEALAAIDAPGIGATQRTLRETLAALVTALKTISSAVAGFCLFSLAAAGESIPWERVPPDTPVDPAALLPVAEADPTVPDWAKSPTPPQESDPTVPEWAKAENPPLSEETDPVFAEWVGTNDYIKSLPKVNGVRMLPDVQIITDGILGVNVSTQTQVVHIAGGAGNAITNISSKISLGVGDGFFDDIPSYSDLSVSMEALYGEATNYTDSAIADATNALDFAEADPVWAAEKSGYSPTGHVHAASDIASGTLADARIPANIARTNAVAAVALSSTNYTDSAVATRATPEAVTNIVHDLSLGGIWDEQIQVWWTPRMRNGSLTYEATTNVNLNAED